MGVELEIRTPDGGRAGAGDVGEVAVRGPNVMGAYWNKPEQTAAALRDGWYHTGDLGFMDEHGYVRVTGNCARNSKYSSPCAKGRPSKASQPGWSVGT